MLAQKVKLNFYFIRYKLYAEYDIRSTTYKPVSLVLFSSFFWYKTCVIQKSILKSIILWIYLENNLCYKTINAPLLQAYANNEGPDQPAHHHRPHPDLQCQHIPDVTLSCCHTLILKTLTTRFRPPDKSAYFFYFLTLTYVVGTQKNHLNETQNICLN